MDTEAIVAEVVAYLKNERSTKYNIWFYIALIIGYVYVNNIERFNKWNNMKKYSELMMNCVE